MNASIRLLFIRIYDIDSFFAAFAKDAYALPE